MKNDNTILLILAGAAIYYIWKNKKPKINKIEAAGLFARQAVENSNVIIPDDSFGKQYKNDQARCV